MGLLGLAMLVVLAGCEILPGLHGSREQSHESSSLVGFLYPQGEQPPRANSIPELHLPLRVGLAFLPSQSGAVEGLEASRREELLERIRKRFSDRKFVSEIVIIPDYYLSTARGFAGLQGIQRLYNIDVMALLSYDQVTYEDSNHWSLGYLTIVGAYVLKGNRHDVTTLVDLAVVDPASRSLMLRAGGTDTRHGTTTLVKESAEARESRTRSFSGATNQLVDNFDVALTKFESDVRAGKANVKVTSRSSAGGSQGSGGGGSWDPLWLLLFASALWIPRPSTRRSKQTISAERSCAPQADKAFRPDA
jgi:rhombotail lipoprotein